MHQHSFDKTESVRLTVFKNISLIITLVALVVAYVNVFMSKNYVLGNTDGLKQTNRIVQCVMQYRLSA